MKKTSMLLLIAIATLSFAGENPPCDKPDERRGPPPKEAIESCLNLAEETACQITTPRGEILEGVCKTTPDAKYFACAPKREKH